MRCLSSAYRFAFSKGFAAYQRERWDEAINVFNQCLVIYPEDNGGYAIYKRVRKYNLDLDSIDTYTATSPVPVAALGTTFYKDSMFYMFTGNADQHHLIVSRWNMNWTAQSNFYDTIVSSINGEWHYFSSGIAYDTTTNLWYIAYHVMLPNDPPDNEQRVTIAKHFRPHLLIHDGYLYMVYDGPVTIKKFKINSSAISKISSQLNYSNAITVFPNPFTNKLYIEYDHAFPLPLTGKLYNQIGECLGTFNIVEPLQELDLSFLSKGFYYFEVRNKNYNNVTKIIKAQN